MSYLEDLTLRLALGASGIDASLRDRHASWLASQQHADGGFAGREGDADPYYTAFALRGLLILGKLDEPIANSAAGFLRSRLQRKESIVDLISWVFAAAIVELAAGQTVTEDVDGAWRENLAGLLASLRTDDGGFAKTPEGRAGSTYQTFLSVLCHQLIDVPVPDEEGVVAFLQRQRHADGGYLEIRAAKRPGINPTAAAIGTLKALGRLEASAHAATTEFLASMQSDEGGLAANTRIPFADLLSTCTGLITLTDLAAAERIDRRAAGRYALAMQVGDPRQQPAGGFVGFALDQTPDVEYTFYGLAALALTADAL